MTINNRYQSINQSINQLIIKNFSDLNTRRTQQFQLKLRERLCENIANIFTDSCTEFGPSGQSLVRLCHYDKPDSLPNYMKNKARKCTKTDKAGLMTRVLGEIHV